MQGFKGTVYSKNKIFIIYSPMSLQTCVTFKIIFLFFIFFMWPAVSLFVCMFSGWYLKE